jgi:magnesium chelatase subunit I
MNMESNYPFTALVGQERLKTALLLNLVDPALGGVLIRGERGTGKSTAVRSLARLAPGAMKVVELPVSATEDRVVGGMDLEHALKDGRKKFQPGILYEAHGNILYVDEINLLDDHLVDLLLDVSAMGVNYVEREGISHSHPSRFVLVGTMNPEEGELRPQLLDRFGLAVVVEGEHEPGNRVEILKRRMAYEADPQAFRQGYEAGEAALTRRIQQARELLLKGKLGDTFPASPAFLAFLEKAAELALHMACDGHRADIALVKTSMALAAWEGRLEPDLNHLAQAAELVFPHRLSGASFAGVSRKTGPLGEWLDRHV